MKPENWIPIASALISAAMTGIGLYLGPKFAVRRAIQQFRSQKWWERQQEAYGLILQHISTIQYDARIECEAIEQSYSRTRGDFLRELTKQAYFEIERAAAQGDYLISPAAAKALQEFRRTISHWSTLGTGIPHEAYKQTLTAAQECISVVSAEAKRTLLEAASPQP